MSKNNMGFIGNLLSTGVNIINVPFKAVDKIVLNENSFLSSPLDDVSKIVKNVDE